jgi:Mrp family chromosome partitioning ATPase
VPDNIDALLDSEELAWLVQAWRSNVDYIIIDTAAVTRTSDAARIAGLADASLLVVRNDWASIPTINSAWKRLEDADVPVLGYIYI